MPERAYHRPISIFVETISRVPDVKNLPSETQMTINLKFNRASARSMVLYLLQELWGDEPLDYIFAEVTGPSP